jgi:hypothetical protein
MFLIVLRSVFLTKLFITDSLELIALLPRTIGVLLVLQPLLIEESEVFQVLFLGIRNLIRIRVLVHQELLQDLFCPKGRSFARTCCDIL